MTTLELDNHTHKMRTVTELAALMNVSRNYIIAMKRHGFATPGGKASLAMARSFLASCSTFRVREQRKAQPPPSDVSSDTENVPTRTNGRRKPLSDSPKNQPRKDG